MISYFLKDLIQQDTLNMKNSSTTKTEDIFKLTAPYSNRYQGSFRKLLFVCSAGMLRSPTAAAIAVGLGHNARSCGSYVEQALIPVSLNLIFWADWIFFLNAINHEETLETFREFPGARTELKAKSVVWNIQDNYEYMEEVLQKEIRDLLLKEFEDGR